MLAGCEYQFHLAPKPSSPAHCFLACCLSFQIYYFLRAALKGLGKKCAKAVLFQFRPRLSPAAISDFKIHVRSSFSLSTLANERVGPSFSASVLGERGARGRPLCPRGQTGPLSDSAGRSQPSRRRRCCLLNRINNLCFTEFLLRNGTKERCFREVTPHLLLSVVEQQCQWRGCLPHGAHPLKSPMCSLGEPQQCCSGGRRAAACWAKPCPLTA